MIEIDDIPKKFIGLLIDQWSKDMRVEFKTLINNIPHEVKITLYVSGLKNLVGTVYIDYSCSYNFGVDASFKHEFAWKDEKYITLKQFLKQNLSAMEKFFDE